MEEGCCILALLEYCFLVFTSGDKIDILLKATGDAPIMKKRKWAVDKKKKIGWIIEFIKKYIKSEPHDSIVSNVLSMTCLAHSLVLNVVR